METIKLKNAISHITFNGHCGSLGQEYLTRHNGNNAWFTPSAKVVEQFKKVIGDKWDLKAAMKLKGPIGQDLLATNIVIDGRYISARGGLCPSGVKLFEIEDPETLESLIKSYE